MGFHDYLPYYKNNLKIAGPIMLSQLGGAATQLADNIMVGQLGTVELAAASFSNAVFGIGFLVSSGIAMAATPLIGRHFVCGDDENVSKYLQNSLVVAIATGIAVSAILGIAGTFFPFMGQEAEVIRLATPYYITLVASLLPFMCFAFFKQFLEGIGNTKIAMHITITANIINIVFNYFLIFGTCGFPKLGVLGAGIATLLSRIFMPVACFFAVKKHAGWWKFFRMFGKSRFSAKTIKELFSVGLPISAQMGIEMTTFSVSAVMVGWIGAASLAAHQIAVSISTTTFMAITGIAAATTIRVSHRLGLKDYAAMKMASNASLHLSLAINGALAIILVIFRNIFPLAFSSDPVVVDLAAQLLVVVACYQIFDSLQGVGLGILRGMTDVFAPMIAAFVSYVIIGLPLGYVLGFHAGSGAVGVWAGLSIGLAIAALFYHIRIRQKFGYFSKLRN